MARNLTVPAIVTVYNPAGKPEQHTRANARDLINGASYTWEKKKKTTPAAMAPFAIPPGTKFAKSKSQEVLDAVGVAPADDDSDAEVVNTVIDEGAPTGPIILPKDTDDDADEGLEDTPAPAPAPRPRRKRATPARMGDAVLDPHKE